MLFTPSFHSLFITGCLLLYILFLFITHFKQFSNLDFYRKITILSLIASTIGIHGLIHLGVEKEYGFNPYLWI